MWPQSHSAILCAAILLHIECIASIENNLAAIEINTTNKIHWPQLNMSKVIIIWHTKPIELEWLTCVASTTTTKRIEKLCLSICISNVCLNWLVFQITELMNKQLTNAKYSQFDSRGVVSWYARRSYSKQKCWLRSTVFAWLFFLSIFIFKFCSHNAKYTYTLLKHFQRKANWLLGSKLEKIKFFRTAA